MKFKTRFSKLISSIIVLTNLTTAAHAGSAVIFSGNDVKTLKPNIDLNGKSKILSGTVDPTSSATSAPTGSIYLNTANGNLYQKLDSGSSANWRIVRFTQERNLLSNPDWEVNNGGWTASGGAYSITTNPALVGSGVGSGWWDSDASGQTLTSNSVAITSGSGFSGNQIAGSCRIKCGSGTCTHKIQIYDGTNVLAEQSIKSTTSTFSRTTVTAVTPSTGNVSLRFISVATDEPIIYVDDCYFGLVEGLIGYSKTSTINYLSANPDAEVNTLGWNTYANGSATPSTGTGGSPTATFTRSTSSPLRGSASFLYTPGALGNGYSYAFTIDDSDKAKVLAISFDYALSGTITEGDYSVWIYDVTNSQLIQPAPYKLSGTSGTNYNFKATFQTASNSNSYRLIIHQAAATSVTLKTDNYSVGPQSITYGAPVTDLGATPWTPTGSWTTNTTYSGKWARTGGRLSGYIDLRLTGAPNAVALTVNLPFTIDTTKLVGSSDNPFGTAHITTGSGASGVLGQVRYNTTNSLSVVFGTGQFSGGGVVQPVAVTNTAPGTFGNGDSVRIQFADIPIQGWSSSVAMSDSADTRVVTASIGTANAVSVPNGVDTKITWTVADIDDVGGMDLVTSRYYVKVPGRYRIKNNFIFGPTTVSTPVSAITTKVYKNGSITSFEGVPNPSTGNIYRHGFLDSIIDCKAGDYLEIYIYHDTGTTLALAAGSGYNRWYIEKIGGPSAIAASESVNAKYVINSTIALAGATGTTIAYPVRKWDTHGSYNTTTGIYTVLTPGKFRVKATLTVASATLSTTQAFTMSARNITRGEQAEGDRIFGNGTAQSWMSSVDAEFDCLAGDQLDVRYYIAVASNTLNVADFNQLTIERVGN